MKIRLLAQFILLFAVATALPFEGNSQALLPKTYKAIKPVPIRIYPEIKRIPPIVPIPISDFTKDQTVLPKVTTVSVPILIDTTVVSEIRNRNRMITLLMMSREDYSFVYEDTPEDALKMMEAIYNREAIVLPHVKMDIPKLVE